MFQNESKKENIPLTNTFVCVQMPLFHFHFYIMQYKLSHFTANTQKPIYARMFLHINVKRRTNMGNHLLLFVLLRVSPVEKLFDRLKHMEQKADLKG